METLRYKTQAEVYAEFFNAAYNLLDERSKILINKIKARTPISKEQQLWADAWFRLFTSKAEDYFDLQETVKKSPKV